MQLQLAAASCSNYTKATLVSVSFVKRRTEAGHCMKHQRDIQCPASRGTVYPFDVSYSALLVTKLTETSVALVYLYLNYSATCAF